MPKVWKSHHDSLSETETTLINGLELQAKEVQKRGSSSKMGHVEEDTVHAPLQTRDPIHKMVSLHLLLVITLELIAHRPQR